MGVLVYAFDFQAAWGAIPWVYPSEIFSMAEKERAISLSVFFQYGANAVIAVVTPAMLQWSTPGTLFVFAALNITNLPLFGYSSRKPKVCLLSRFLPCSGQFAKQSVTITTRRRGSRGRIDNLRAQIAALMQANALSLKKVHFSTKCIFDGARRTSCQWLRSTGA